MPDGQNQQIQKDTFYHAMDIDQPGAQQYNESSPDHQVSALAINVEARQDPQAPIKQQLKQFIAGQDAQQQQKAKDEFDIAAAWHDISCLDAYQQQVLFSSIRRRTAIVVLETYCRWRRRERCNQNFMQKVLGVIPNLATQVYQRALAVLGPFAELSFDQWETLIRSQSFERVARAKYVIDICNYENEPLYTRVQLQEQLGNAEDDYASDSGYESESPHQSPGAMELGVSPLGLGHFDSDPAQVDRPCAQVQVSLQVSPIPPPRTDRRQQPMVGVPSVWGSPPSYQSDNPSCIVGPGGTWGPIAPRGQHQLGGPGLDAQQGEMPSHGNGRVVAGPPGGGTQQPPPHSTTAPLYLQQAASQRPGLKQGQYGADPQQQQQQQQQQQSAVANLAGPWSHFSPSAELRVGEAAAAVDGTAQAAGAHEHPHASHGSSPQFGQAPIGGASPFCWPPPAGQPAAMHAPALPASERANPPNPFLSPAAASLFACPKSSSAATPNESLEGSRQKLPRSYKAPTSALAKQKGYSPLGDSPPTVRFADDVDVLRGEPQGCGPQPPHAREATHAGGGSSPKAGRSLQRCDQDAVDFGLAVSADYISHTGSQSARLTHEMQTQGTSPQMRDGRSELGGLYAGREQWPHLDTHPMSTARHVPSLHGASPGTPFELPTAPPTFEPCESIGTSPGGCVKAARRVDVAGKETQEPPEVPHSPSVGGNSVKCYFATWQKTSASQQQRPYDPDKEADSRLLRTLNAPLSHSPQPAAARQCAAPDQPLQHLLTASPQPRKRPVEPAEQATLSEYETPRKKMSLARAAFHTPHSHKQSDGALQNPLLHPTPGVHSSRCPGSSHKKYRRPNGSHSVRKNPKHFYDQVPAQMSLSSSSSVSSSQKRGNRQRERLDVANTTQRPVSARKPHAAAARQAREARGVEVELYYHPQEHGAGDAMAPRVHHLKPVPEGKTANNSPMDGLPIARVGGAQASAGTATQLPGGWQPGGEPSGSGAEGRERGMHGLQTGSQGRPRMSSPESDFGQQPSNSELRERMRQVEFEFVSPVRRQLADHVLRSGNAATRHSKRTPVEYPADGTAPPPPLPWFGGPPTVSHVPQQLGGLGHGGGNAPERSDAMEDDQEEPRKNLLSLFD